MILAFHCIITNYGFWLPNEPRGSWSDFVRSWELHQFGPATKVNTRRSVARRQYDHGQKRQMQASLQFDPVVFTGEQAKVVGQSLQIAPYMLHELAVMPKHTHAVLGHAERDSRRVVGHVKSIATRALRARGWFLDHCPWTDHGWNVYLDCHDDVDRAVRYVHGNPEREGLRAQRWHCVVPYNRSSARGT